MNASEQYRAFLLRLWRTPDDAWRASLDDPRTGERLAFASLEACCEYLLRVSRAGFAAPNAAEHISIDASDLP
jgi:hypothetical protein